MLDLNRNMKQEQIIKCRCGAIIPSDQIDNYNRCNEEGEEFAEVVADCKSCGSEYETSKWGEWHDREEALSHLYEYIMDLTFLQIQLLEFVKEQHGEQKRKYTLEPYWKHPYAVALMVGGRYPKAIEIALCHDLFEDTPCTFDQLYNKMIEIGYERDFAYDVCGGVKELTDVYTKEAFPYLNRRKRKENEAKRLGQISPCAQTVKYADLIDNTSSIVAHDPNFAKTYLAEKYEMLKQMKSGNEFLYKDCLNSLKRHSPLSLKFIH